MEALEQLKSVLCDPEGSVCISGSDGDRKVIADALESLEQQVAALTQEKGVYAAANRAAYDGMTAALEQLVAARADAKQADQFTHKALDERDHYLRELQAAQADNARLREALMGLRRHSLCPDTMVRLLDTPTDDSALMERLKQERERCAERLEAVDGEWITKVAASALIRSMT